MIVRGYWGDRKGVERDIFRLFLARNFDSYLLSIGGCFLILPPLAGYSIRRMSRRNQQPGDEAMGRILTPAERQAYRELARAAKQVQRAQRRAASSKPAQRQGGAK